MKMIVSVVGTALLMGAVALAQTSSGNTGSNKSSAKKASTTSSASPAAQSGSSGASTANSASTGTPAASSGFDSGLPQSDSSANAGTSGTSSAQIGPSAYGSGSGQTSSSPSSSAASQTGSSPSTSGTTQSGLSDEISNGPVAETVGDSSVVVGWATRSAASNTGIKYGTSRANMTETAQGSDGADGKNHHARLQGLSPSTRYYFQVTENGAPVGGVGTFKTTAAGETPVQSKAVIPQK